METFEILARKSRKRLMRRVIIWSTAVVLSVVGIYTGTRLVLDKMTNDHLTEIMNYYDNRSQIAYPNLYFNNTIQATNDFSNLYQLSRFKDIHGVPASYDSITASAGPTFSKIDHMADVVSMTGDGKTGYNLKQHMKVPLFFNTKNKDKVDGLVTRAQELPLVKKMTGQLVEVALSFDKPYSYDELQSMLPANLKQNWFWLGSYSEYDTTKLDISNIFGIKMQKNDIRHSFNNFRLKLTASLNDKQGISSILTSKGEIYNTKKELAYLDKSFKRVEDCKFLGIILTGKAEDFAQLEGKEWIYASSIGASIPNQPYYQLDRE